MWFKEWLSDNLRYLMLIAAVALGIAVIVIGSNVYRNVSGSAPEGRNDAGSPTAVSQQRQSGTGIPEGDEKGPGLPETDAPLITESGTKTETETTVSASAQKQPEDRKRRQKEPMMLVNTPLSGLKTSTLNRLK